MSPLTNIHLISIVFFLSFKTREQFRTSLIIVDKCEQSYFRLTHSVHDTRNISPMPKCQCLPTGNNNVWMSKQYVIKHNNILGIHRNLMWGELLAWLPWYLFVKREIKSQFRSSCVCSVWSCAVCNPVCEQQSATAISTSGSQYFLDTSVWSMFIVLPLTS